MNIKRAFKERVSDGIYIYRKLNKSRLLKRKNCRILMYHSVKNSNLAADKMGLAIPHKIFYMHMNYLKENEFYIMGLLELADKIAKQSLLPNKSIVITFDDGYKSIFTNALPIIKDFGFPASLFVNIHFMERKLPKNAYWQNWQALNWEEVKQLQEAGLTIGSHALSHQKLTEMTEGDIKKEIKESKELIEKNIGGKIFSFSYPHGSFNNSIKKILRDNNFYCACSSIGGTNNIHTDIFSLRRTEISAFDDTLIKFEKKILGSNDWLKIIRSYD